jgi:hypothetical protein
MPTYVVLMNWADQGGQGRRPPPRGPAVLYLRSVKTDEDLPLTYSAECVEGVSPKFALPQSATVGHTPRTGCGGSRWLCERR